MSSKSKTTATKEDGKPALTPKLRFPEFRDAEGWDVWNLGRVAENLDNRRVPITSSEREAGEVPYYGASGVVDYVSGFIFDEDLLCVSEDGANLVARSYPIAFPISGKTWVNNHAHVLRFEHQCTQKFVEVFLNSIKLDDFITGMAQPKLNKAMLDSIPIPHPDIPEQKRVAACLTSLTSLDDLIAAQTRKLDALKTHKKGLMQQLFPREGETQPRLRFPEFQNAGQWEVRELSDFITERNQYPTEKAPLFSLTIEDGVTPKTARYERSFLVNDEADAYKLVMPNDFAFNPMNLRFGAIGRHSGTEKVAVSKYYNIFSCDGTVDSRFCEIYFRSDGMVAFYDERAIGSLIEKRRVHFAAFLKFNIRFPWLREQQRIADCLTTLDDLITAQTQKLDALKTHKKGLMQQLFPSAEGAAA